MKTAEVSIYLDHLRPKKNGLCSVKIRVTFFRKRKYYSTGIELTPSDFESVQNNKRRTPEQKEFHNKLTYIYTKASKAIDNLPVFTFDNFEKVFLEQRNTRNSVSFAFDEYIEELKKEKRIGTAVSYECAKNSIEQLRHDLTFAEITPTFLKKYESWMLENGKSVSTIGIYLRSLRALYNRQGINPVVYPFGEGEKKYSIPTSRNIKKALTIEDVAKIYHYEAPVKSTIDMAKDYWVFLYLSNGMNVKDFCLLKWENIDGEMLKYKRSKTKRTKKESKTITVALKPETKEIIRKWGQLSVSASAYIFPHLKNGMSAETERAIYQQLTKTINKYIKKIAFETGINKPVTTYFARHSFATILKRSGATIELISELLGHSNVNTTESYLDSFENDTIQKETDALTVGFKIAG